MTWAALEAARSIPMADINLKVLDLSHFNNAISFEKIYAFGIRGIIHKASQGTGVTDTRYASRRPQAIAAGLLWGAYHFADSSDPVAQAKHFIHVAEPDAQTLVALDFERNEEHTMSIESARAFLKEIELLLGRKAVV